MANGKRIDPYMNYSFKVQWNGIINAGFQEVSGLEATIDVVEYNEGGDNRTPRKLPGRNKFSNIVLKRGLTDNLEAVEWLGSIIKGKIERRNLSIMVMDSTSSKIVAQWDIIDAWPAKYTGPSLNAEGNDVSIETLELAHEGMTRVK